MSAVPKSPYNLVRDAEALGMTPSRLLHKARKAWQASTAYATKEGRLKEELLRDIQRSYRRQYDDYLRQQRNAHQLAVAKQMLDAARVGKLEENNRPVSMVRAHQLVAEMLAPAATPLAIDRQELAQMLDTAIESVNVLRQFLGEMRQQLVDKK